MAPKIDRGLSEFAQAEKFGSPTNRSYSFYQARAVRKDPLGLKRQNQAGSHARFEYDTPSHQEGGPMELQEMEVFRKAIYDSHGPANGDSSTSSRRNNNRIPTRKSSAPEGYLTRHDKI